MLLLAEVTGLVAAVAGLVAAVAGLVAVLVAASFGEFELGFEDQRWQMILHKNKI